MIGTASAGDLAELAEVLSDVPNDPARVRFNSALLAFVEGYDAPERMKLEVMHGHALGGLVGHGVTDEEIGAMTAATTRGIRDVYALLLQRKA